MFKISEENHVKFYIPKETKISKKLPVFYNPLMKLNRDISIEIIKTLKPKSICLPLAGTGIRGLRILKETKSKDVTINDVDKTSYNLIRKNLKLNNLKATTTNKDANLLLKESEGYDYIDIDPFGPPIHFLDTAVRALKHNGILALTATDTAALTGSSEKACLRKYSIKPLKTEFSKELGTRILITKAQNIAAQYEKALIPILSYSIHHYMRTFLISKKSITETDNVLKEQKYLEYCPKCLYRNLNTLPLEKTCPNCKKPIQYAGPIYSKEIQDKEILKPITIPLIETIKQELPIPFYYDTHRIGKVYKKEIPKVEEIIKKIKSKGYKASRTHFAPEAIKTDLEIKRLIKVF